MERPARISSPNRHSINLQVPAVRAAIVRWHRCCDSPRLLATIYQIQIQRQPLETPPTYIAKMQSIEFRKKNVFFHKITPKSVLMIGQWPKRLLGQQTWNFSKMKNLKVDRWALSLNLTSSSYFPSVLKNPLYKVVCIWVKAVLKTG